jgi:hypothetical protein
MKDRFLTLRRAALLGGAFSLVLVAALLFSLATANNEATSSMQAISPGANGQSMHITQTATTETSEGRVVRQRDFGTWRYQLTESLDGLRIHVDFSDASIGDLQSYATANRALLPEVASLGGRAEVAITFVHTLNPDQFRAWARSKGIEATLVELRSSAPGSTGRATIGIVGTPDDPLPQDRLASHNLPIHGVYAVRGTVEAGRLAEIAADQQVFLVDVTPAWVRNDLAREGIREGIHPRVNVKSPFWQMEELGLQHFSRLPLPTLPPPVLTAVPVRLTPAPDNWIEHPHP